MDSLLERLNLPISRTMHAGAGSSPAEVEMHCPNDVCPNAGGETKQILIVKSAPKIKTRRIVLPGLLAVVCLILIILLVRHLVPGNSGLQSDIALQEERLGEDQGEASLLTVEEVNMDWERFLQNLRDGEFDAAAKSFSVLNKEHLSDLDEQIERLQLILKKIINDSKADNELNLREGLRKVRGVEDFDAEDPTRIEDKILEALNRIN
ncbi:MAG: hypothetical protein JJU00_07230 [Opitutales bacterium]|nr:hypothetical protein [Opitutales bacterium]